MNPGVMPLPSGVVPGRGGTIPEQRVFTSSGTFVAPVEADYLASAIGAGAAGTNNGRGGGAGGFSQIKARLKAGERLDFTVGAGGVTSGQAGGNTTVTGPGVGLTANGGTSTAGGTASGGTVNVAGGASASGVGTGGGAVGVYGVGFSSGLSARGGGAGVGGASTGQQGGGALSATLGLGLASAAPTSAIPFGSGRLLQPLGRGGAVNIAGEPGGGGGGGAEGGMFAGGGGGENTLPGAAGGAFGGGGGGGGSSSSGGPGGVGGVIIEWQS